MSIEIIPAILTKRADTFKRRLLLVQDHVSTVQVDIMDGTLVPNTTWFDAPTIASWNVNVFFELHLMVNDPVRIIDQWSTVHGIKRVLVHADIPKKVGHVLTQIESRRLRAGIAISPRTKLSTISPYLNRIESIQVMGNVPGLGGQRLDPRTIETVRTLRRTNPNLPIGFDIGVNAKTIPLLAQAGVTRFVAGSAIFNTKNPIDAIRSLEQTAKRAIT